MELNEDLRLEELQIVCHCCLMACSDLESFSDPGYHPKRINDEKFGIVSQLYAECVGSEVSITHYWCKCAPNTCHLTITDTTRL